MGGEVQLRTLSSTTHCREEVRGHFGADVHTTPSVQRQPNWKNDETRAQTTTDQLWLHPETVPFPDL